MILKDTVPIHVNGFEKLEGLKTLDAVPTDLVSFTLSETKTTYVVLLGKTAAGEVISMGVSLKMLQIAHAFLTSQHGNQITSSSN